MPIPAKRPAITFDTERLIAEVAARHGMLLGTNDAAFALVTINQLVLVEALEAIHARVAEDVALMRSSAQTARQDAESAIAIEVRRSAASIRAEIACDLRNARMQTEELVGKVRAIYERPMSDQKFYIVVLVSTLILVLGFALGRNF